MNCNSCKRGRFSLKKHWNHRKPPYGLANSGDQKYSALIFNPPFPINKYTGVGVKYGTFWETSGLLAVLVIQLSRSR